MLRSADASGDFQIGELSGVFRPVVDVDWHNYYRHPIGTNRPDLTDDQMQQPHRKTRSSNRAV